MATKRTANPRPEKDRADLDRFEELAKALVNVPKKEVDALRAKEQREKRGA